MSLQLTSQEALKLTARFALTADRMRSSQHDFEKCATLYETASRVAFLRAHLIAKQEEIVAFGDTLRRAAFAIA